MEQLNTELSALLRTSTHGAATLESSTHMITRALAGFKKREKLAQLGFVAGIRESDGPESIARNSWRLSQYTSILRGSAQFPLFSCMDIYDKDFLRRFDGIESPREWDLFWRRIFEPKLITDLYLTPRWHLSKGTLHEKRLGEEFNLEIHDVGQDRALMEVLWHLYQPNGH